MAKKKRGSRTPSSPLVPAIRDGLDLKRIERGGRKLYVVVDAPGEQQVSLDPLGAFVLAALDKPQRLSSLSSAAERHFKRPIPHDHLQSRLRTLSQSYLLQGPRSNRYLSLKSQAKAPVLDPETVELLTHPELRHACQACGGCCSGPDIGPLPTDTVERIEAHDWSESIPALADKGRPFRQETAGDQSIWLAQMVDGACVFLDEAGLCRVHAELGAPAKPTICRQFPYRFTHLPTGEVAVSIAMECRSWLKAKAAAEPTASIEADLRALLAENAPRATVREPFELVPGLPCSWHDYRALETRWLELVETAEEPGRAIVADLRKNAATMTVEWRAEEAFLGADEPTEFALRPDEVQSWFAGLEQTIAASREDYIRRDNSTRARMHEAFWDGMQAWGEGYDARIPVRSRGGVLQEVQRDVWRSSLFAREPLWSIDVELGLVLGVLGEELIAQLASSRSKVSGRVEILDRDVVDSMVVATTMLRQWSVSAYFAKTASTVRRLVPRLRDAKFGPTEPAPDPKHSARKGTVRPGRPNA